MPNMKTQPAVPTSHTPTKLNHLKVSGLDLNALVKIEYEFEGKGYLVGRIYKPEDAAFIVHAINAHEELVDVLKAVLQYVKEAGIGGAPLITDAREALARAEGK